MQSWTVWVGWPWAPRWGTVGGREGRGMRGQAGIELLALAYSIHRYSTKHAFLPDLALLLLFGRIPGASAMTRSVQAPGASMVMALESQNTLGGRLWRILAARSGCYPEAPDLAVPHQHQIQLSPTSTPREKARQWPLA